MTRAGELAFHRGPRHKGHTVPQGGASLACRFPKERTEKGSPLRACSPAPRAREGAVGVGRELSRRKDISADNLRGAEGLVRGGV